MAGLNQGGGGGASRGVRAGRAYVEFGANDRPIYRSLNALERRFSSFRSVIGGIIGGIAGGGVVAGVQGLSRSFQGLFDKLNETARSGAAAKAFGLTPEQFTGIAGVAASVGEQQREFIESLVTLGKVVSEGVAGTGEVAANWFSTLNLNAAEFAKLPLDQQFLGVFDAIRKVESPAARVRALMVAFGEDGGKYLLPLLSKSQDELLAMAKSFEVSAEQVSKAEEANQSWIKATSELNRTWREFAVELAPAATTFLNDFLIPAAKYAQEMGKGFQDAQSALAKLPQDGGPGGGGSFWKDFADSLPSGRELVPAIVTGWKMQGDAWKDAGRQIDNAIGDFFGDRRTSLRLFSDSHKAPHPDDTGAGRFLNKLNEPPPPGPPTPTGIVSGWVKWARDMEASKAQADKLMGLFGGAGGAFQQSSIGGFLQTFSEIQKRWFIGRGDAGPWRQAMEGVGNFAESVRGGFGGGMLGRQFARGERVAEQQLDALKGIREEVGEMNDKATPLVFG